MLEFSSRLALIDQKVHQAMLAIDNEGSASDKAKEAVHEFCEKSEEVLRDLNGGKPDARAILSKVLELEELGDRAKDVAKDEMHSKHIEMASFQKVLDAHNSVSNLKRELGDIARPNS